MVLPLSKLAKLDQNVNKRVEEASQKVGTMTSPFSSKLSADVAAMFLASITYFSLAVNLSGIPDVPTGSSQEFVLEDTNEEIDTDSIFASFFKADDTETGASGRGNKKFLRFVHPLTDNCKLVWETALWNNRLYIEVPTDLIKQGSRDSLVALLDAAEEHLGCTQAIIRLPRDIVDRAQLIRTFKFMGFELVSPDHPELPVSPGFLFMAYDI